MNGHCLTIDKRMGIKLHGVTKIARLLGKVWEKHRVRFVPSKSPLMTFINNPHFIWIREGMDLTSWQKYGISQFADLLIWSQMIPWTSIKSRFKELTLFQYDIVKSIIDHMIKRGLIRAKLTKMLQSKMKF